MTTKKTKKKKKRKERKGKEKRYSLGSLRVIGPDYNQRYEGHQSREYLAEAKPLQSRHNYRKEDVDVSWTILLPSFVA